MAERSTHHHGSTSRRPLFFVFSILTIAFVFLWFSFLDSTGRPRFIDHSSIPFSSSLSRTKNQESAFGGGIPRNREGGDSSKCDPGRAVLKVFLYDLHRTRPGLPGGLNLQHSIEYWLTLDLLSSASSDRRGPCAAVRVEDSREADVVFVPFFSSLSYNRHSKVSPPEKVSKNKLLQDKLVEFMTAQKEWKRSGGRDHIIVAHHPNSMLDSRSKLFPCMFILADFGRYPPSVANVDKDVVAPYKHVVKTFANDSSGFDDRPTLLYFQGAIYRKDGGFIRQELFYLLKDEKDVHFSFGTASGDGIRRAGDGMRSSKFCLNIAGDTPSSNRLFDAIASHCIPVVVSDEIELPYEDVLDYSEFCEHHPRGVDRMWLRLKQVEGLFEYQYPSMENDAVQMIWRAVARKVPAIRRKLHRSRRFSRFEVDR
ncbi:unnamed protein product [Spirodela intermedia]|uniref:Exostosin GT47 domain-containing protein n=1 Tax=Spirodela intermedia TaxID=51605 RepID=A0A7I8ICD3_SPIIN|nr:unnamed protein product [Spirodela intermedia]CAA6654501.1 unnamed protein product [Spirodela intermedia]